MLTSLSIENFRGFRNFKIGSLERVNLIGGANGAGKTALLEALFLLIGETNLALTTKISAFRGLDKFQGELSEIGDWFWAPLFRRFNSHAIIKIEGQFDDDTKCKAELRAVPKISVRIPLGDRVVREARGDASDLSTKALEIEYVDTHGQNRIAQMVVDEKGMRLEPPSASSSLAGYFLSAKGGFALEEDAKLLGELLVLKEPFDLLEALRIVEPRLTRVNPIPSAGGSLLYGDIGLGRMLPLALMGDGLGRFAAIMIRIATAQHGIVLIDEVENGLHYTALRKVWLAFAEAARRFDVQVFATTHSWECIQAAHEAFEESGRYDFRFHRLDRLGDDIQAATYDQEMLTTALATDLEVR